VTGLTKDKVGLKKRMEKHKKNRRGRSTGKRHGKEGKPKRQWRMGRNNKGEISEGKRKKSGDCSANMKQLKT